ncbi:hypothetical protein [Ensifer sp. B1-9]|uniref:hypothetical protein n=1 Tax=Ensifer sp. B1-9 TaxID=3141455 RepID=UPI003D257F44
MAALGGFYGSVGAGQAQDAISAPGAKQIGVAKTQMEPSLIVLNSHGATLVGGRLVLSGVSPNSIVFADRPVRAAGHVLTAHLLAEWATGTDSFAKDSPNATVSVLGKDGTSVVDAVVTLKTPKLDGEKLTFDVDVLEGSLDGGDGSASVFIDIIGMPFTPLSYAGVARRTAYRGAWYASAAAGAAAAYDRARCGFYPYPPCY